MAQPTTFDTFFPIAAQRRGQSYGEAKGLILSLPKSEADSALKQMKKTAASDPAWERVLAARILSGWMEHKELFTNIAMMSRGELPGPKPMAGFTPTIRAKAIAAEGKDATPRVIEMLYKIPEYADDDQRNALFAALVFLKDDLASMPMIALASDPTTQTPIRIQALNVVSRLGDARGLDKVIAIARDPKAPQDLREAAIRSLAGFSDPKAAQQLVSIMQDDAKPITDRQVASGALKDSAGPELRQNVVAAIRKEKDPQIRLNLVALMGKIGTRDDVAFLQSLAADPDAQVAEAAADAIRDIAMRR